MIVRVGMLLFFVIASQCASCLSIDNKSANSSAGPDYRKAYEIAMNRTIDDYYAQRKAVMDKYYARQREIRDKINERSKTTATPSSSSSTTFPTIDHEFNEDSSNVGQRDQRNDTVMDDIQAESTSNQFDRIEKKEIPGYYRLGEFKGSKDERVIYQHNLGVGLKGPSQLEANFEVVLESGFAITVVEAFPYANTRAHFSWLSGGPGTNSVKLKLKGYENEGFSYTVKVWGVPAR